VKERRRKGQPANGQAVDSVDWPDTKRDNQTKKQKWLNFTRHEATTSAGNGGLANIQVEHACLFDH